MTKREATVNGYEARFVGVGKEFWMEMPPVLRGWWRIGWELSDQDARAGRPPAAEKSVGELVDFPHPNNKLYGRL